MKTYGEVEVYLLLHAQLTSALDNCQRSSLRSDRFTPGTNWIVEWVDLRACLDAVAIRRISVPAEVRTQIVQPVGLNYRGSLKCSLCIIRKQIG